MITPPIDTTVAHPARRYNYWLGGKDHFAADRDSADQIKKVIPYVETAARANRDFMHRVVRHITAEAGVRQFIDIGVGLPVAPNVHQVAQQLTPSARILYADNDPLVMAHAQALHIGTVEGATAYTETDLCDPVELLSAARKLLDFDRPIAVLLLAVLHFIPDELHPEDAVAELVDGLPSGSYVVLSHGTSDFMSSEQITAIDALPRDRHGAMAVRTRDDIARFFDGLTLVAPGLVLTSQWPNLDGGEHPEDCAAYAGTAVKPWPSEGGEPCE